MSLSPAEQLLQAQLAVGAQQQLLLTGGNNNNSSSSNTATTPPGNPASTSSKATGMCDEKTVEYLRDLIAEKQAIEVNSNAANAKSIVLKLLDQGKIIIIFIIIITISSHGRFGRCNFFPSFSKVVFRK